MKSNNVGIKIQNIAFVLFWVTVILIVVVNITALILNFASGVAGISQLLLIITCPLEILAAYVSYLLLTGFGRIVEASENATSYFQRIEEERPYSELDDEVKNIRNTICQ